MTNSDKLVWLIQSTSTYLHVHYFQNFFGTIKILEVMSDAIKITQHLKLPSQMTDTQQHGGNLEIQC